MSRAKRKRVATMKRRQLKRQEAFEATLARVARAAAAAERVLYGIECLAGVLLPPRGSST